MIETSQEQAFDVNYSHQEAGEVIEYICLKSIEIRPNLFMLKNLGQEGQIDIIGGLRHLGLYNLQVLRHDRASLLYWRMSAEEYNELNDPGFTVYSLLMDRARGIDLARLLKEECPANNG